jgi:arylesterase/paraoxonase
MKKSQLRLFWAIFGVWLVYFCYQTVIKNGIGLQIKEVGDFNVKIVNSEPGIEDITIDKETNMAYFSSHDRRNFETTGSILSSKIQNDSLKFKNLTKDLNIKEFRPHGISLIKLIDGRKFLFVISHTETKHNIYKFEIREDSLSYVQNYYSTEFVSPNDILAIGENQFFITNDHDTRSKWRVLFNDFFRIPTGNIVFFDGQKAKVVSNKIVYPNGIAISKDKSKIFVTSTLSKKVMAYIPQAINEPLQLQNEEDMKYAPDNIEIDNNGDLIIACHPKTLNFLKHRKSPQYLSPSSIIKVNSDRLNDQKEIFTNNGDLISGSSVAAPFLDRFGKHNYLVGCVFDKKILVLNEN